MQVIVSLAEIGDEGLDLARDLPVEFLTHVLDADGQPTGYRATAPSALRASFRRVLGGVFLDGALSAALAVDCRRCLTPVRITLPVAFQVTLVRAARKDTAGSSAEDDGQAASAGSFELADVDEEVVAGGKVDVLGVVREQILLALPPYPQCAEQCRGLCGRCGTNLNEGACRCPGIEPDSRWSALHSLKIN